MGRLLSSRAVVVVCAIGAITVGLAGCGGKTDSASSAAASIDDFTPTTGASVGTSTSASSAGTVGEVLPDRSNSSRSPSSTDPEDPRLTSCQLWLKGAQVAVAQSRPYQRQAQRTAATATDPKWADVSRSMGVLVGLPPTGLSPEQVTQARTAVSVITSNCAALGVHIPR
jgi:hypothetical protein